MNSHYIILQEECITDLENEVNKSMEEGYVPIGGPFHWVELRTEYLCQAMLLKETIKDNEL